MFRMKYQRCTDWKVFGFGILIPKEHYSYIAKYKKKLEPYIEEFPKKDYKYPGTNYMRLHITIKYLGYHKKYTNKQIEKLVPELREIAKKYLPITIKAKGLKIGTKYNNVGILLNYKTNPKVRKFHNEIIKKLGNRIDIFKDIDGKNFSPHIAIASAPKKAKILKELRKIAKESKKDKTVKIRCIEVYIFFKNKGPKIMIRKSK